MSNRTSRTNKHQSPSNLSMQSVSVDGVRDAVELPSDCPRSSPAHMSSDTENVEGCTNISNPVEGLLEDSNTVEEMSDCNSDSDIISDSSFRSDSEVSFDIDTNSDIFKDHSEQHADFISSSPNV